MDGRTLGCGAVTGVRTVKNPISLARLVMDQSEHVFFAGDGAERFADLHDVERVDPSYFDTPGRYRRLQEVLEQRRRDEAERPDSKRGTVGCVVLDRRGDLGAGTSTGGLTAKRFGRIGDSPVIGAGTYANNRSCAVSCTGTGEEFIRHTVARDIAALVEYRGMTVEEAGREVVHNKLRPDDGGVIIVGHDGQIALVYSTGSMLRARADSTGHAEVRIWEDDE